MTEVEAYEKLHELLGLAEELKRSGHYSVKEILDEIKNSIGEE